jgi:hypothetical protein
MSTDWRFWLPACLAALSLAWCVFFGFWLWSSPGSATVSTVSASSDGSSQTASTSVVRVPFSEMSQYGVLPLVVPVVVAAMSVVAALARAWGLLAIAGLALGAFAFLALFSIGAAYVVPALATLIAAGLGFALD